MKTLEEVFLVERDNWQKYYDNTNRDSRSYKYLSCFLSIAILPTPLVSLFFITTVEIKSAADLAAIASPWVIGALGSYAVLNLEELMISTQSLEENSKKMIEKYGAAIAKYNKIILDDPECADRLSEGIMPLFDKHNNDPKIVSVVAENFLREPVEIVCNGELSILECGGIFNYGVSLQ